MKHKKCSKCKKNKKVEKFYNSKSERDGYTNSCRKCHKELTHSKKGVITVIYGQQLANSRKRKHAPPTYTRDELEEWLFSQKKFHKIYNSWVLNNYNSNLKPSCDRKDKKIGYSFINLKLMTWDENNKKGIIEKHKPVTQYSQDGTLLVSYKSIKEATLTTGVCKIGSVCSGVRETAGGFIWRYTDD